VYKTQDETQLTTATQHPNTQHDTQAHLLSNPHRREAKRECRGRKKARLVPPCCIFVYSLICRLVEFSETPTSSLTVEEFEKGVLEMEAPECDPPAFTVFLIIYFLFFIFLFFYFFIFLFFYFFIFYLFFLFFIKVLQK
jgi:hypothetical protein